MYMDSDYKEWMVLRLSNLYHGNSHAEKTHFRVEIGPSVAMAHTCYWHT